MSGLPSGTVTFLFTDIEGSTRLLRRLGERYVEVVGRHDRVVRAACAGHGGREITTQGDAFFVAFERAGDAVAAAVRVQRALAAERWPDGASVRVRMGLHTGEPVIGGENYVGLAVHRAARICAAGHGGQILLSTVTRELLEDDPRPEISFRDLGDWRLKDFDRPEHLFQVVVDGLASDFPPLASTALQPPVSDVAELPPELDAGTPLVGREAELDALREEWRRAHGGTGRLVLIAGERGMGKTRLAAELAGEVHRDRGAVLHASGAGAAKTAIEALACARDTRRPTLLVLDDVDRANADVRAEFDDLVGALPALPVLVVVTAAESDLGPGLRADETIVLAPLDADGVRAVVRLYAGERDDAEVPFERLAERSGGVPLRLHRAAVEWTRTLVAHRLVETASRIAAERPALRAAEDDLAASIVELHADRERPEPSAIAGESVICPFKGLASFDVDDAGVFFGRERLVAEMVARLTGAPLMGIVGPSGSGKSSVLRAGLLAALAAGVLPGSERWAVALLRPGEHPMQELEQATADAAPRGRLVIAVDQFEEAFTACRDATERGAFVDALVASAPDPRRRAVVLVAVRADFYGRCTAYPELSRLLGANHVLVGPMQPDELRRAIELPARRAGLHVEPELVDALVNDVEDEPGALPLLSTALLELWQHHDGRRLRHATYERTGGVRGAVGRLAEEAFGELDRDQQRIARSVLLRLAGEGAGGAVVRRRVALTELHGPSDDEDLDAVLGVLADRRLLTISTTTVEVAHEALLREWPRLRAWIEEDREGLRIQRRLTSAAQEWDRVNRDEDALYRGVRLTEALEWRDVRNPTLSRLEREFLAASVERRRRDVERRRREREGRARRIKLGFAALAIALGAIMVVAGLALHQGREARHQRDLALSRAIAASADNLLGDDPSLSLSLAMRAVRAADTEEAQAVLRQATLQLRALAILRGHKGWVNGAAFSPNGQLAVSAGVDGRVRVWDLRRRRLLKTLRDGGSQVFAATFSPDGRSVGIATEDGTVSVTDLRRVRWRTVLRVQKDPPVTVAYSPDGQRLVLATAGGPLLVTSASGGPRKVLRGHQGFVFGAEFSPDGGRVVSSGEDRTVRVWDVSTATTLHVLRGHTAPVTSAHFDAKGRRIVSTGYDNTTRVWDTQTGKLLRRFDAPYGPFVAGFSPDGRRIVTAGQDGAIRVLDALDDRAPTLVVLRGHKAPVTDARFSPDGRRLISASQDGTVRLWDPGAPVVIPGPTAAAAFSSDGRRIITAGRDGSIRVRSAANGLLQRTLPGGRRRLSALAVAPDGRLVAAGDRKDGAVRVWQVRSTAPPLVLRSRGSTISSVAFSRNSRRIVTTSEDGFVLLWTLPRSTPVVVARKRDFPHDAVFSPDGRHILVAGEDGLSVYGTGGEARPLVHFKSNRGSVYAAAFSPDGRTVASAGADGAVRLWTAEGHALLVMHGHGGPVQSVAFRPDGRRIVSAGTDGTVRIWDPARREPLVVLRDQASGSIRASFDSTGRRVLSADADGNLWISPCEVCGSLPDVLALARARAARQLTPDEQSRFLEPGG